MDFVHDEDQRPPLGITIYYIKYIHQELVGKYMCFISDFIDPSTVLQALSSYFFQTIT